MGVTLEKVSIMQDSEQSEMNRKIHPLLDEFGIETAMWAIQACIASEETRLENSLLNTSKPVPEEQVIYLLKHALGFYEEERAQKLASIISVILTGDDSRQVYRSVFTDYLDKNSV